MDMERKTDGQLVAEFAATGREEPFEELVRRHGGMVLGVCQRVLGRRQDGEDMMQAVFLTLAQKAAGLVDRASLAGWLHLVAWHTSLRARRAGIIRQRHERAAALAVSQMGRDGRCDDDLWVELDHAMSRLPVLYREPLVLHYLEGRTIEESAVLMACKTGTVASRLARGRAMLRERLETWGLALTVAATGELLLQHALVEASAASASFAIKGFVPPLLPTVTPVASVGMSAGQVASMFVPIRSAAAWLILLGASVSATGAVVAWDISSEYRSTSQTAMASESQNAPQTPKASDTKKTEETQAEKQIQSPSISQGVLPEPQSLAMLAMGAAMLLRRWR